MRYECDEPGYEGNWVEFERRWTRKERSDYVALDGEDWLALISRKIDACHLECVDGDPIRSGAELTQDAVDNRIDALVWDWFSATVLRFRLEMGQLGEALRRRSLLTIVPAMTTPPETLETVAANSQTHS